MIPSGRSSLSEKWETFSSLPSGAANVALEGRWKSCCSTRGRPNPSANEGLAAWCTECCYLDPKQVTGEQRRAVLLLVHIQATQEPVHYIFTILGSPSKGTTAFSNKPARRKPPHISPADHWSRGQQVVFKDYSFHLEFLHEKSFYIRLT